VKTVNVFGRVVRRAGVAITVTAIAIRVVSVLIANACINATTTSARTAIALPASVR